ncbi:MAG: S-adenosylmethionine decarboxylase [Acidobacteria bacterium]|nr:S-adenosylmethionine decarboxylase [Acidobacteriota bacterium]MCI0721317.1 S-adenosylmethionine decarboxylase [Acidobacteriota bacterium]
MIEAFGCSAEALCDKAALRELLDVIVAEMNLAPVGEPVWHQFPGTGGVTGIWLLQESHLALHSFPEYGSICLNLFCCKQRPSMPWKVRLAGLLGSTRVDVREFPRNYGQLEAKPSACHGFPP